MYPHNYIYTDTHKQHNTFKVARFHMHAHTHIHTHMQDQHKLAQVQAPVLQQ